MSGTTRREREAEARYFERIKKKLANGERPRIKTVRPGVEELLNSYGYSLQECLISTGIKAKDKKEYFRLYRKYRRGEYDPSSD